MDLDRPRRAPPHDPELPGERFRSRPRHRLTSVCADRCSRASSRQGHGARARTQEAADRLVEEIVDIRVAPVRLADKEIVRQLLEFNAYEFARLFDDAELNEDGTTQRFTMPT